MLLLRPRVTRQDKPGPGIAVAATSEDSLLSAIVKWIPVEVLTVYRQSMASSLLTTILSDCRSRLL